MMLCIAFRYVESNNFQIWRPQYLGLILVIYQREILAALCGTHLKGQGLKMTVSVTCDITPHHFRLFAFVPTRDFDVGYIGPQYKITNSTSNHDLLPTYTYVYVYIYSITYMYHIYTDIHKIYVLYLNTKEIGSFEIWVVNIITITNNCTKLTHLCMCLEIQFHSLSVLKNTHGERWISRKSWRISLWGPLSLS